MKARNDDCQAGKIVNEAHAQSGQAIGTAARSIGADEVW